jgi:hypothetical protein
MGVIYRASLRTTRMTSVRDDIDSGVGAGTLEIGSAGFASVLAVVTLADPCGSVSGDVLTLTMPQSDPSIDNTGTAAEARIKESGGTVIVSGLTVGISGTNIIVNSTAFQAAATFTLSSGTITHNTSGV